MSRARSTGRARRWILALLGVFALSAGCVKQREPGTLMAPLLTQASPLRDAARVSQRNQQPKPMYRALLETLQAGPVAARN